MLFEFFTPYKKSVPPRPKFFNLHLDEYALAKLHDMPIGIFLIILYVDAVYFISDWFYD